MRDFKSFICIRREKISLCCWICKKKDIMIVSYYWMIYTMRKVKDWYDKCMICISSMIIRILPWGRICQLLEMHHRTLRLMNELSWEHELRKTSDASRNDMHVLRTYNYESFLELRLSQRLHNLVLEIRLTHGDWFTWLNL